ncbi:hypothetical protein [Intestinibacter bartlettii]|uniref:hypothetical protein n=1 Tax=Intestinibacter bartlettii TaxID=261299 RepID=UPI003B527F6B
MTKVSITLKCEASLNLKTKLDDYEINTKKVSITLRCEASLNCIPTDDINTEKYVSITLRCEASLNKPAKMVQSVNIKHQFQSPSGARPP